MVIWMSDIKDRTPPFPSVWKTNAYTCRTEFAHGHGMRRLTSYLAGLSFCSDVLHQTCVKMCQPDGRAMDFVCTGPALP